MTRNENLSKTVEEFKKRMESSIEGDFPVKMGVCLKKAFSDAVFHPGLFVTFTCTAASGSRRISREVAEHSMGLEYLYLSAAMQDKLYRTMACLKDDGNSFDMTLSRLSVGSRGLSGIDGGSADGTASGSGIIDVFRNLCDSEINALNIRMELLKSIKSKPGKKIAHYEYAEYARAAAPRIIGDAILIGNLLAGRKNSRGIEKAGEFLSSAFFMLQEQRRLARSLESNSQNACIFDVLPLYLMGGIEIPRSEGSSHFIKKSSLPAPAVCSDIIQSIRREAGTLFSSGAGLIEKEYGEKSRDLLNFAEMCRCGIERGVAL